MVEERKARVIIITVIMVYTFAIVGMNFVLNLFLIPVYGVIGAEIATGLSFILIDIFYLIFVYPVWKIHQFRLSYPKIVLFSVIAVALSSIIPAAWLVGGITDYFIKISLFSLIMMFFVFLTCYFLFLSKRLRRSAI